MSEQQPSDHPPAPPEWLTAADLAEARRLCESPHFFHLVEHALLFSRLLDEVERLGNAVAFMNTISGEQANEIERLRADLAEADADTDETISLRQAEKHIADLEKDRGEHLATIEILKVALSGRTQHDAAQFPNESHPWVKQLRAAQGILGAWNALKGQDRCWHHPVILRELCVTLGVILPGSWIDGPTPEPLPSRAELERGCREYQDELYGKQEPQHDAAAEMKAKCIEIVQNANWYVTELRDAIIAEMEALR